MLSIASISISSLQCASFVSTRENKSRIFFVFDRWREEFLSRLRAPDNWGSFDVLLVDARVKRRGITSCSGTIRYSLCCSREGQKVGSAGGSE